MTSACRVWHGPDFLLETAKECNMPNPEWGVKRTCPSCGARFYDLMRSPIICPSCEAPFEIAGDRKASSAKASPAKAAAVAESEPEEDLIDDDDAVVEETDNALLDDDDDDDDSSTGPSLSDEEDDDKPIEFEENVLIDDGDDDDDIEELGDVKPGDGSET